MWWVCKRLLPGAAQRKNTVRLSEIARNRSRRFTHAGLLGSLSFWPRHNRRIITQQKAGQWVPGEQEIVFTHRFIATLRCRGDKPPMIFVLHSLATRVHLLINPCPTPALLRAFSTRSLLPYYVHNLISESPTVARYNFSYPSLLPHA